MTDNLIVRCSVCGFANEFPQPYAYHAGFGDTVFLYNEAGNCTITWGTYDQAYERLVGGNSWHPALPEQALIEAQLPRSPKGDRWSFASPARCTTCAAVISEPMISGEIYYLEYPGSVILGRAGLPSTLADLLTSRPEQPER